jgi:hypothetical protein
MRSYTSAPSKLIFPHLIGLPVVIHAERQLLVLASMPMTFDAFVLL